MDGQLRAASMQIAEMQTEQRMDQRAWLSVSDITTKWKGENPDYFNITVTNKGKTPALKVTGFLANIDSLDQIKGIIDFSHQKIKDVKNFGMIAPGEDIYIIDPISPEQIKKIRNGVQFFITGQIVYRDIYGKDHWTRFCRSPSSDFTSFTTRGDQNQIDETKY